MYSCIRHLTHIYHLKLLFIEVACRAEDVWIFLDLVGESFASSPSY
jgi:hypothetical protein